MAAGFCLFASAAHERYATMPNLVLFTGNANPDLARKVAAQLHIALGDAHVGRDASARRDPQLAGPRPQRRGRRKDGGAGQLGRSRDDQHHAALVLVSLLGRRRERQRPEHAPRHFDRVRAISARRGHRALW